MNQREGTSDEAPTGLFTWQAHPARERPGATVAACVAMVALSFATFLLSESKLWAVAAAVVLCLALNRFFFSTRYELDDEGITAEMPLGRRRLGWDEILRAEIGTRAAWLSPLPTRSWRESRRGIHVLYGPNRQEVIDTLRAYLKRSPHL